jgi:hypothetical protein
MTDIQNLDKLLDEAKIKLFEKDINDLGFPDHSLAYELFNDLYMKYFHNNNKALIISNPINKLNIRYGECEDCKSIGLLMDTDACMCGYNCTEKYICLDDCQVKCSNGHLNYYNVNCDGWVYAFKCCECDEIIQPKFVWWGLSPAGYREKYRE